MSITCTSIRSLDADKHRVQFLGGACAALGAVQDASDHPVPKNTRLGVPDQDRLW
jgi:hypothetical protein